MQFAILWGYYLLCEGLFDGRTLGKRLLGLRAVRDGGYSVGFAASAVRNLMRIVDLQPVFTYLVGIAGIAISKSGKRLGDVVAGTIVVREAMVRQPVARPPEAATETDAPSPATTLAQRRRVPAARPLGRAARRASTPSVAPRSRSRSAARLHTRHRRRGAERAERHAVAPARPASGRARQRGVASRGATGASRERYAIVTTRSPRWIAFAAELSDAQRRGPAVVQRDAGPRVRRGVSRAVGRPRASAHGDARLVERRAVLPRPTRRRARTICCIATDATPSAKSLRFIAIDVPTEVRRSVVPIALGAAFLFGPAAIAWTAVVRNPERRRRVHPDVDARPRRGRRAAREAQDGLHPGPEVFRPLMASRIIANNVQVTFAVFAFGVTAGIGTLAHARAQRRVARRRDRPLPVEGNSEVDRRLRRAARRARAVGDLHRRRRRLSDRRRDARPAAIARAVARSSRTAAAPCGSSPRRRCSCIVAGSLEGMVSPIPYWPLWAKLAVSATTLVLMVAYLTGGARLRRPARAPEVAPRGPSQNGCSRSLTRCPADAPRLSLLALSDPDRASASAAPHSCPRALISRYRLTTAAAMRDGATSSTTSPAPRIRASASSRSRTSSSAAALR